MRLVKFLLLPIILFLILSANPVWAQNKVDYAKGIIKEISSKDNLDIVTVLVQEGIDNGKNIKINYDNRGLSALKLKTGEEVVVTKETFAKKINYSINDRFRLPYLGIFIALFVILTVFIAGKKGLGGIIGIAISLAVIFLYIVPNVVAGHDPVMTAILGGVIILVPSTFIAHGFTKQTTVALISTLIALFITWFLSIVVLQFYSISGFATEEASDIHLGIKAIVDFRGLFLAGIIIATLGALNDVTTSQAASVFEIYNTNKKIDFDQLLIKGMNVGREHVTSLINTLVLAFIGSSLAVFIIYFYNPNHTPLWVIVNSEVISEEIIKTILGTIGLLLSMPIVTVLSTFVCVNGLETE